jgi:hypothetical protein
MLLGKGMARAAFQAIFKFPRQVQGFEGRVKLHLPWPVFRRVGTFALIVLYEAALKIIRVTPVKLTGSHHTFQDVSVKHKVKRDGLPSVLSAVA